MATKNKSAGEIIFDILDISLLSLFAVLCIYPILHAVFASLSDPEALAAHSGLLYRPIDFTPESYKVVFSDKSIGISFLNTLYYLFFGLIINMILTSFRAYALSVKNVGLSKPILLLILFTMFFSGGKR